MKNNKSLGQHWLKKRALLDQIADLAAIDADSETLCVEIGPGLGTLTSSLLKRFHQVIAIEYDERLAVNLPKSFPGKNLEVLHEDILRVDLSRLVATPNYVVAGNIPYYITSPIIRHLLSAQPKPQKIVLLIQKEVAERIAAEPGRLSVIALLVQNLAEVELGPVIKAEEFTPPPKVDSQVIILRPLPEPVVSEQALKLAQKGFSSPRKKLVHNLATADFPQTEWRKLLERLTINPDARAQDLDLLDWEELLKASKKYYQIEKSPCQNLA